MRRPNAVLRAFHACVILLAILAVGAAHDAWARTREAVAKDARLAGDRGRTRFIADLSKKVDVSVFSLADPYRVIVDLPEVNFQMPAGLGTEKRGLVTGYRYGLFAPGKSRIVIDMSGPFLVDKAFVLDAASTTSRPVSWSTSCRPTADVPRQAPRCEIARPSDRSLNQSPRSQPTRPSP